MDNFAFFKRESGRIALIPMGLVSWFLLLLLSGCMAVGPDYHPPVVEETGSWHAPMGDGLKERPADSELLAGWWNTLDDSLLTNFIQRAFTGNLDLKQARARVRQARAALGIADAGRLPDLKTDANAMRSRSSDDSGMGMEQDLFQVGFDAAWELDIFGGIRRSVEAAEADLAAGSEALNHVRITLAGEVARNYVEVRSFQKRLAIAGANLAAQQESVDMVRDQFQAGLTGALALEQARYNLSTTRSTIPTLRIGLARAQNRLAVLLGEYPGALEVQLTPPKPIPVPPLEIAVGIPADLLRRRPDVRQAERELAARSARIGVATSQLYPKLTLTGSIGLEALSGSNLFNRGSATYGAGPAFSWNLFNGGAIRRNIDVETARREEALIHYKASILQALEEVENALTAYAREQLRRESLEEGAVAAGRAVDIARDQYRAGLTDFQNVLEAQRSLFGLQDQLAQSREAVTQDLVSLYKALGGGWTPLET